MIELICNYRDIEKRLEINTVLDGIFLTIRKNVKGLEHENEDILLSEKDCECLINILQHELRNNYFIKTYEKNNSEDKNEYKV